MKVQVLAVTVILRESINLFSSNVILIYCILELRETSCIYYTVGHVYQQTLLTPLQSLVASSVGYPKCTLCMLPAIAGSWAR